MSGSIQRETLVIGIAGRDVTLRLEREVTAALAGIAAREDMSLEDLVRRVAAEHEGGPGSLASSLRAFAIAYNLLAEA